jgi:hypothetical protein
MPPKTDSIIAEKINILPDTQIRNILNSLFYEANKDFLLGANDISEYDIQNNFFKLLKNELKNKGLSIKKERKKRDISIQFLTKQNIILDFVIELKTFIKKTESISFENILKDIKKLKEFISQSNIKNKKAFILIAATQMKLIKAKGKNKLFSDFCIHNHNRKEFESVIDSEFKVYRSFFIGTGNNGNSEPILNQIRFFLFEIKK